MSIWILLILVNLVIPLIGNMIIIFHEFNELYPKRVFIGRRLFLLYEDERLSSMFWASFIPFLSLVVFIFYICSYLSGWGSAILRWIERKTGNIKL